MNELIGASSKSRSFKKVLIANRGEIAIRIMRAATELGIRTVAVYSHEDRFSLHRFKADEAYRIGKSGDPLKAYLDHEAIVDLATTLGVEAIHPGYGFLSESQVFAQKCQEKGIKFIGPSPKMLGAFGDKVKAREVALAAGLQVIPGVEAPLRSVDDALKAADEIGYPITLKAVSGGGGKGIRMIQDSDHLAAAFQRAKSEAMSNFGAAEIYLEKRLINPKHIEVQLLGDEHGNLVHLFERDCSIQRRHQKVVEVAPAAGISGKTRQSVHQQSLTLGKYLGYSGLGTVEFLVDDHDDAYFLEVNPRVQVEHTVTEMITGIDLIQASILVASGVKLSDPRIGIESQQALSVRGHAIQCRITTEDPLNNFAPDTGKIIAYRPAAGFGIRLDEGHGTSGGTVTPFYDSLLVKVTAWAPSIEGAAAKMRRSLSEFRIRGVRHNIPLLKNVVAHPTFLSSGYDTSFLEVNKDLFKYPSPKDRATKMLRYLGDVTVNNPHGLDKSLRPSLPDSPELDVKNKRYKSLADVSAKQVFDEKGADGLKDWIKCQERLLITDTTMRDAHQSLFATRLRTRDILKAAPLYNKGGKDFFSLEVWGGATFDSSLRFLKEDPWRRLAEIRKKVPNVLLQMLLRGDNAVGYTNYPKWVIKEFVKEAVAHGLDIFRVFDCLNQPDKMETAISVIKQEGAIAELCVCYTGNLGHPKETKYTLGYYQGVAKQLESMGADILCIKDMAGLLRPSSAKTLIKGLKEVCELPIHLHTHDTSGTGVAMLLEAADMGCDIVDGAVASMSGLTSQPSINAVSAALEETKKETGLNMDFLDDASRYWQSVRSLYQVFDPGVKSTSTEVYKHEIPGGQYSNLFVQAKNVGLSADEFHELTKKYQEVNKFFGNIVKVTPSSKVVGDMALLLHKSSLTCQDLVEGNECLDYPDSVRSFFKGHMGVPFGGFPEEARELILGQNPPPPAPLEVEESDSLKIVLAEVQKKYGAHLKRKDALSYRLYPKVFDDYRSFRNEFGRTNDLTTPSFFFGLKEGEEVEVDIEPGKTLIISLSGISNPDNMGRRKVFFMLNGFPREVEIVDQNCDAVSGASIKARAGDPRDVGANMPGKVLELKVEAGQKVESGQVLLVTESMKMEYEVKAKTSGTVAEVAVKVGQMVEEQDLLIRLGD